MHTMPLARYMPHSVDARVYWSVLVHQAVESRATCHAALDGLPKVGEDKYDKLMGVLKKRFEPYGEIREGCFWMPKGDDGVTKGYAFIEYSKREVLILVSVAAFPRRVQLAGHVTAH